MRRYLINPKYIYGFGDYAVSIACIHGTSILGALVPISMRCNSFRGTVACAER